MRIFLALIASAGLVGCVGGIDVPTNTEDPDPGGVGGGGSGDAAVEAKRLFETNVHPVVARMCVGCHSAGNPQGNITGFVSTDLTNAYVTAVGYQAVIGDWTPTGAPILTKITAASKTPSHQALAYSNDETNKITEWLNKELEARGAGQGNPTGEGIGAMTQRLLEEWSGCMTLENFEAADMRQWGNSNSNEGQCRECHGLVEYNYVASNTSGPVFFATVTEDKYNMLQYFSIDLSMGQAMAKIIPNERSFEGVGNGLPPHQQHPSFNPQNIAGYDALQTFYTTTMAAKMAAPNGICGPKKLLN